MAPSLFPKHFTNLKLSRNKSKLVGSIKVIESFLIQPSPSVTVKIYFVKASRFVAAAMAPVPICAGVVDQDQE